MENKRLAVLIYQLCFAEERRLDERVENAYNALLRHQGELEVGLLFKALNQRAYLSTISQKIFDILRSLEYNEG